MSEPRISRNFQKELEKVGDLDFTEEKEGGKVYTLDDGTTIEIELELQEVKRPQKWKPDGSPIYIVQSANVVRTVNMPKGLKVKSTVTSSKLT